MAGSNSRFSVRGHPRLAIPDLSPDRCRPASPASAGAFHLPPRSRGGTQAFSFSPSWLQPGFSSSHKLKGNNSAKDLIPSPPIHLRSAALIHRCTWIALLFLCALIHPALAQDSQAPPDFPRFEFQNHEEESALLSRFLWHFFDKRAGNFDAAFILEYMMTADIWMAGANPPSDKSSIQELKRRVLDRIEMDPEGYVNSHQHFSHAHDRGWPFPLYWQQIGSFHGLTYGWHWGGPQIGFQWQYFLKSLDHPQAGESAIEGWELENAVSSGISENAWVLEATGESPAILTPPGITFSAFHNPFMQLRWRLDRDLPIDGNAYMEWMREGDTGWRPECRITIYPEGTTHSGQTGMWHSLIRLYDHPEWKGTITRIRLNLAPGMDNVRIRLTDFFSVYDTRKPYNNLHYVMASWDYFRWTGDLAFLRKNINRIRESFAYARRELSVDAIGNARVTWPGHDGLSGWLRDENGNKIGNPGHGIGNNYYDILPFGWDDMYLTTKYFAATRAMARIEQAIADHPQWAVEGRPLPWTADELFEHAQSVKTTANEKFWNPQTGRFVACIDKDGAPHDYGYTFVTLEAIWFGIATDEHARTALDWITGRRIVEGDTSQGDDIYRFQFGPRASTRRNIEWYSQGWVSPEDLKFGEQIQDGGAVLGFTLYDFYARLKYYGPDNAWERLSEFLDWQEKVDQAGGYREYYKKTGIQLQGGGTAGGVGIDHEFVESSLPPSVVPYGFLGLDPTADALVITPSLPQAVPSMTVRNLLYRGVRMDIRASSLTLSITLHETPADPLRIELAAPYRAVGDAAQSDFLRGHSVFQLPEQGGYEFVSIVQP